LLREFKKYHYYMSFFEISFWKYEMLARCLSLSKIHYCFWSFTKHAHNCTYMGLFLVLYHFSLCSFSHLVLFVKCYADWIFRTESFCVYFCLLPHVFYRCLFEIRDITVDRNGHITLHGWGLWNVINSWRKHLLYMCFMSFYVIMSAVYQVITILTEILVANIRTNNNSTVI
jgi:hypothetical protein